MTKATLSTEELAVLLKINPRSVHRWARSIGVAPLRRQRIGKSTVTVWPITALGEAARDRVAA